MLNGPGVSGSFQADNGLTALVPGEVPWTDRRGAQHHGDRPECLWDEDPSDKMNRSRGARVEAGYRWIDIPGGGSYPLVMWQGRVVKDLGRVASGS